MKFYEVETPEGPRLVRTKPKGQSRPVEIPTDKEGLMNYVNDLRAYAVAEGELNVEQPPKWGAKPEIHQATSAFEHDDIVEAILASRGFQLANYFDAVMEVATRIQRELRENGKEEA